MDNLQHPIIPQNTDGTAHWPFQPFYADLKKNGFSLTPTQIINANQIIIQYANWVKNENELCLFLTPVFASNEDEQILFKQVFDAHFRKETQYVRAPLTSKNSFGTQLKKHWKQFIILYAALALIIVALIFRSFAHNTRIDNSRIEVYLLDKNNPGEDRYPQPGLHINANEKLEMDAVCSYPDKKKTFTTNVRYDWGDDSRAGEKPWHVYTKMGTYTISAYVEIFYQDKSVGAVTLNRIANVCTTGNFLKIEFNGDKESVLRGQVIKLKALFNAKIAPDSIQWTNDGVDCGSGPQVELTYDVVGQHDVTCQTIYFHSPCDIEQEIHFSVIQQYSSRDKKNKVEGPSSKVSSVVATQTDDGTEIKKVPPSRYWLYGTLAIVFSLFFLLFIVLREREMLKLGTVKKAALDKYKKIVALLPGDETPGVLPFRNKNYLPMHESEISEVAKQMRKRVNDNSNYLHVDKTIRNSIEKMGMFQPVIAARTRQTEYLALIDENENNSLQVKFFEYLILLLKKQNVLVDVYYYRNEPKFCYNINEKRGISLERLFVKHERHILLVFGDAHWLIDETHAEINPGYRQSLNRWQYKAMVTPVPYPDWGTTEKEILLSQVPVFPADKAGIDLLTEMLAKNETGVDIVSRLRQNSDLFYKTEGIDLTDIDALIKYCNNAHWAVIIERRKPVNILFQWIAALAIYPKIRWEIILAIGKAILVKYDLAAELSYTNLLRIVRIGWIKQGSFPPGLRLELLKCLGTENEKTARETMLFLLKEIPEKEVEADKGAFKEKEVQQVINEFSLYANDPAFYSDYKRSKNVFRKLWEEDMELDEPVKEYMLNADGSWKTLINRATVGDAELKNVGIGEYFEATEREETLLSKFYLWIAIISVFVALSSIVALRILYVWDNYL